MILISLERILKRSALKIVLVTVVWFLFLTLITINAGAVETLDTSEGAPVTYDNPILEQIKLYNPSLAYELSILPELKGNTASEEQNKGLRNILEVIKGGSPKINDNISILIETVGLKCKRAYCTPIESILWIAKKNSPRELKIIIADGNLTEILRVSWGECKGPEWQVWEDEGGVKNRLNELQLLEYFMINGIDYIYDPQDGKEHVYYPQEVLDRRGGDCEDFAGIQEESMENAGYESYILSIDYVRHNTIYGPKGARGGHAIGVTKWKDGKYYYVVRTAREIPDGINGPFDSDEDLVKYVMGIFGDELTEMERFRNLKDYDRGISYLTYK